MEQLKFTPKHTVSYHGVIHKAGVPFYIDTEDAEAMGLHGEFDFTVEVQSEADAERPAEPEKKKAGRPKKN